ncbi:MAG TPA: response regulator [Candidatus Omnitrophota bacterium]|nr:response regulator [Candidatus Omnitrophota bacterium]
MNKRRILVIDDEEHLAKMVKLNLEATGKYRVKIETRGSKAFETAKEFKPEFIFLDIVMRDQNGFEVMYQLESDSDLKLVPVVFLTGALNKEGPTGNPSVDDRWIGQYEYLIKPAPLKNILHCIERHLKDA